MASLTIRHVSAVTQYVEKSSIPSIHADAIVVSRIPTKDVGLRPFNVRYTAAVPIREPSALRAK